MTVASDGRPARTRYEVERVVRTRARRRCSRCTLETGRTHQIRVHLLAIGHPVVGDEVYGDGRPDPAPAAGLGRLFLHAARPRLRPPDARRPHRLRLAPPGGPRRRARGVPAADLSMDPA